MKTWGMIAVCTLFIACGGRSEEATEVRSLALSLGDVSESERQAFDEAASRVTRQTLWTFPVRLVPKEEPHQVSVESVDAGEGVRFDAASCRMFFSSDTFYASGGSYEELVLHIETALYRWREEEIRSRACRRD